MTKYDQLLCDYIIGRYRFYIPSFLLDIGCGKGNHVWSLQYRGIDALGIDREDCNLETESIPKQDDFFDFVFCKSVIEHIHNTEHLLAETLRVLKPGGIAVFMTPDWNTDYKHFWDDPTHVKPFTRQGLEKAFKIAGFVDVDCQYFWQLPFLWRHPWLETLRWIISLLPDQWKWNGTKQRVLIRHSKERMLIVSARKGDK